MRDWSVGPSVNGEEFRLGFLLGTNGGIWDWGGSDLQVLLTWVPPLLNSPRGIQPPSPRERDVVGHLCVWIFRTLRFLRETET